MQCKVHGTGVYEDEEECDAQCKLLPPIQIVDVVNNDDEDDEHYCLFTDESDDCRFYFVYGYDPQGNPYIKAQQTKDCPPEPPVFWIVSGVVGAIVLIGLLFLVLWKLLTHIADRREYARFEKERMSAKWDAVSWQKYGILIPIYRHLYACYFFSGGESHLQASHINLQESNVLRKIKGFKKYSILLLTSSLGTRLTLLAAVGS